MIFRALVLTSCTCDGGGAALDLSFGFGLDKSQRGISRQLTAVLTTLPVAVFDVLPD